MSFNLNFLGRLQLLEDGVDRVNQKLEYAIGNAVDLHNRTRYTLTSAGGNTEVTLDDQCDLMLITSDQPIQIATDSNTTNQSTTFTANDTTDEITLASNLSLYTGKAVTLTTTDTLPAGLATSTTYYVVSRGATELSLAASLADAENGTGTIIDITDTGTGTHTITESDASYYRDVDQQLQGTMFLITETNVRRLYMKNNGSSNAIVKLSAYRAQS